MCLFGSLGFADLLVREWGISAGPKSLTKTARDQP